MKLTDYRFELEHNGYVIGSVCGGATEMSEACNDPAIYWLGLRALTAATARARALGIAFTGSTFPGPRRNLVALVVG